MTLIIDPQTGGIAGNMIIGALVDLGANPKELKRNYGISILPIWKSESEL